MAYNPGYDYDYDYDSYNRPTNNLTRRRSMGFSSTPVPFPIAYSDSHSPYHDPMVSGYRDNGSYPQPSYQIYAPPTSLSQRQVPYTQYDDMGLRESYSTYPPVVQSMSGPRLRRSSSVSYPSMPKLLDNCGRPSPATIKFKRKGAFSVGITLREAQASVKLAGSDNYTSRDLGVDYRGRITLKIRWTGYMPLTYEIPIDGYEGYICLQTLARRVARAVEHFIDAHSIPVHWDNVELHCLEEQSTGVWQTKLMTTN